MKLTRINDQAMNDENKSVADFLGPWVKPDSDSGLIERCRNAWCKPLRNLTNHELATFLQQQFAVEDLLPIANRRMQEGFDDGTEIYDGELECAIREGKSRRLLKP